MLLGGSRGRCLEHSASVRVAERPVALHPLVLVQLRPLPLAQEVRGVPVRQVVDLVGVLDAEQQEIAGAAVLLSGHLDPAGASGAPGVDVRHPAVQHEVAGLVVLLVQRALAIRAAAAEGARVQGLHRPRGRLGMRAVCHPVSVREG